jgi:hypothetical protein
MNARLRLHGLAIRSLSPASVAGTALADAPADIRDIRGPKAVSPSWVMTAVVAAVLVAAILVYVLWRRRQNRARPGNRSLSDQTLERLDAARSLMTPATARDFGSAASEVVRRYIEQRFEVIATQRTTEEFLHTLLQSSNAGLARHRALLANFLEGCDIVKFAGASPAVEDMERLFQSARRFVLETSTPDLP